MKLRNLLSGLALVAVTAIPTVSAAQVRVYRNWHHSPNYYGRTSYGRGPFYPSYIPGPSYQYFGSGGPYRVGGATYYFGPGGGYYGSYPYGYYGTSYYSSPRPYYRHRRHR